MFVGTFTMRMFIKTFTIVKRTYYSLIYSFFHLFVIKIDSRGYLKKMGNNLRRIVNTDSWHIEPRLCRPCSRICYTRDRCYYFKYFVEPFVNSYVLFLLLIYKIGERLNDIFHCFLY